MFILYLAQNHPLTAFSLLGLAQTRSYQLHIASIHGDNPYFAAFIALKPSGHTYFIAVIYRSCGGDLRYWFVNLRHYLLLFFISVNSRFTTAQIYAWFLWFTSLAYKKINLYLCKAKGKGRFCDFSAALWEAGAFFQTPLAPIPRQGRWHRDNIKTILSCHKHKNDRTLMPLFVRQRQRPSETPQSCLWLLLLSQTPTREARPLLPPDGNSAPPYTYYIYSSRALSSYTQQTAYCIHIAKRKRLASKHTSPQSNKTKS